MVWLPFFIFPYIENNHPNWLYNIFQRGSNHQPVYSDGQSLRTYFGKKSTKSMGDGFPHLEHSPKPTLRTTKIGVIPFITGQGTRGATRRQVQELLSRAVQRGCQASRFCRRRMATESWDALSELGKPWENNWFLWENDGFLWENDRFLWEKWWISIGKWWISMGK